MAVVRKASRKRDIESTQLKPVQAVIFKKNVHEAKNGMTIHLNIFVPMSNYDKVRYFNTVS